MRNSKINHYTGNDIEENIKETENVRDNNLCIGFTKSFLTLINKFLLFS